ncbi:MAG: DNA primase catalytic subunit PriS [Halobacteria archaeon]|nr:DNA primase catalytic subunit PriS [Halobacteria archaeon]
MNDRTQSYVRGRFGDYYRRTSIDLPRSPDDREWAFIPFSGGMVRHRSLLDLGDLETWLADQKPRHVYFSSARYESPEASSMKAKGWTGAQLVFDLDADHLRETSPDDSYSEMLSNCKTALVRLVEFLVEDFGFDDVETVFSGGRGYHVHVYDDEVQRLGSEARREIVDYVQGMGFDPQLAFSDETAAGDFGRTPTGVKKLESGGWGRRIRDYILDFADEVAETEDGTAVERLREFEGVGQKKAEKLLSVFRDPDRREELARGNLDVVGGTRGFWETLMREAVSERRAEADEPVTTDTKRLIRLPGSLHGGTGLRVTRVEVDEIESFDPLTDAVVFSDSQIQVESSEPTTVEVGGRSFNIDEGVSKVPEYAGVFAVLRKDVELA